MFATIRQGFLLGFGLVVGVAIATIFLRIVGDILDAGIDKAEDWALRKQLEKIERNNKRNLKDG